MGSLPSKYFNAILYLTWLGCRWLRDVTMSPAACRWSQCCDFEGHRIFDTIHLSMGVSEDNSQIYWSGARAGCWLNALLNYLLAAVSAHNLFPTVNLTSALKKKYIHIHIYICFEQCDLRGMWNSVDHIALGRTKFMLRDPGMQFPAPRSQKCKESELILCAPGRAQCFGFQCVLFGFSQ